MDATVEKVLNASLKFTVSKLIGQIPVVGGFLNAMIGAFWPQKAPHVPTPQEVFDSIKDRIEELVDAAITANDVNRLQAALKAIGDEVLYYQKAADDAEAKSRFVASSAVIIAEIDAFKQTGLEVTVLPLYAQAINTWLAFLRDGVLCGTRWGYDAAESAAATKMMQSEIADACSYVDTWYQSGLSTRQAAAATLTGAAKFNKVNDFVREMTLLVLDYREMWPMFDPVAYPSPVQHTFTRELYAHAQAQEATGASTTNRTPITLPSAPAGPIRQVHAKSWGYGLKQLQVDYDPGAGPNGLDSTGPMGPVNINGLKETKIDISGATLTTVTTSVGDITDGISFAGIYAGKPFSTRMLGSPAFNPVTDNAIAGHQVSSIFLAGRHLWNNDVYPDVIVVGFKADPTLPI